MDTLCLPNKFYESSAYYHTLSNISFITTNNFSFFFFSYNNLWFFKHIIIVCGCYNIHYHHLTELLFEGFHYVTPPIPVLNQISPIHNNQPLQDHNLLLLHLTIFSCNCLVAFFSEVTILNGTFSFWSMICPSHWIIWSLIK